MRRATPARALRACVSSCALTLALSACGSEPPREELTLERLPGPSGTATSAPVVDAIEPYRMANGALRVKGRARLPDGALLQIAIKEPGGTTSVAMAQVRVEGHRFDTPPLLGERGPLPRGSYRVEVLAHFTENWQGAEVMRALRSGEPLQGPGITRARDGEAALFLVKEGAL
jgi:hypothetical protein